MLDSNGSNPLRRLSHCEVTWCDVTWCEVTWCDVSRAFRDVSRNTSRYLRSQVDDDLRLDGLNWTDDQKGHGFHVPSTLSRLQVLCGAFARKGHADVGQWLLQTGVAVVPYPADSGTALSVPRWFRTEVFDGARWGWSEERGSVLGHQLVNVMNCHQ